MKKLKAAHITILLTAILLMPVALISQTINGYYEKFQEIMDTGDWSRGEQMYREAVQKYPDQIGFQTILNHCLVEQKKFDEAVPHAEKLFEKYPDNTDVKNRYAYTMQGYGWYLWERKQFSEALEAFKKALELMPGEEWGLNGYGVVLRDMGNLEESIKVLGDAYRKFPENRYLKENYITSLLTLGWNRYEVEGKPGVFELFERAYQVDPEYEWSLNAYGVILRDTGRYKEGAEILETGYRLYPHNEYIPGNLLVLYKNEAQAAGDRKKYKEALEIEKRIIKRFPGEFWILMDLCLYSHEAGDYKGAMDYLLRIFDTSKLLVWNKPVDFDIKPHVRHRLAALGHKLAETGSFKQGLALADRAEKRFPGWYFLPVFKGRLLYHAGEKEEGIRLVYEGYDRFIAARPELSKGVEIPLPLKGYYVVWGNSRQDGITHAGMDRFCFDFIGAAKDRNTLRHGTEGLGTNSDYVGFGDKIYSPVAGVVDNLADEFQDLAPSEIPVLQDGNYISIKDDSGRYFLFVHNRQHSARVKKGERVKVGQVIAELGNSGYTTVPHLHFGVYDPEWEVTLPVKFTNYRIVSGGSEKRVSSGVPQSDELIFGE